MIPGKLTLLDLICVSMHCDNQPEKLRRADRFQKKYIAQQLEQIQVELPSLSEWNECIHYLIGGIPQASNEAAKSYLIQALQQTK